MRKQRFGPAFLVLGIMFLMIAAYVVWAYESVKPASDKICNGVYIDNINISGMTKEEAGKVLQAHIEKLTAQTLEVDVNGQIVSTTLGALGYKGDAGDAIEQALRVGKEGGLFSNYAHIKAVEAENVVFPLEFSYSEKKVKKFVKNQCGKKCTNAVDAKIKMKNGKLVYTESKDGVTIDTDATIKSIQEALRTQEDTGPIRVSATVLLQKATVDRELASRCNDKLGTFSTKFNAGNIGRSKNVANAARLINGTVIKPGETFSVHDAISPMTEKNGYYAAPSYSNGQVVDSIGGGVCQVSTTLYNAVLMAELEVVERSPHSMVVSYVEPSMDAAIAGDYKDLKFRNDSDVPVFIEGGTYSGTIYFNVYGEETRSADRKVKFESEVTETIEPGADKVTYDKTKPSSYEAVTQEAHIGYKAVLWKIVTENGETEKTQVNSSTYQAEPRYVTRGAMTATPTPKKDDKDNKDKDDGKKPKETAAPSRTAAPRQTQKPKETAAPKATDAPATPEPTAAPATELQ